MVDRAFALGTLDHAPEGKIEACYRQAVPRQGDRKLLILLRKKRKYADMPVYVHNMQTPSGVSSDLGGPPRGTQSGGYECQEVLRLSSELDFYLT